MPFACQWKHASRASTRMPCTGLPFLPNGASQSCPWCFQWHSRLFGHCSLAELGCGLVLPLWARLPFELWWRPLLLTCCQMHMPSSSLLATILVVTCTVTPHLVRLILLSFFSAAPILLPTLNVEMIWLISSTDGSTTRLSITCFQTWLLCSTGSSSHLSRAFARSTAWCTCRRMPWSAPGWCFKWLWVMQPWSDVPLWCHRKLMEKTRLKLKVPKIPKSQVHETRSNWICDISARQAATPSSKKRMVKWAAHASNWQPALSFQLSVSLVSLVLRLVRRHHHCPLLWKSLFVAGHGRIWPCSEETSNGGRAPDWLWPRFSIADVVGSIVITFLTFVLQACHTAQSSISVYFSSVLLLCAIKTLSNGFGTQVPSRQSVAFASQSVSWCWGQEVSPKST